MEKLARSYFERMDSIERQYLANASSAIAAMSCASAGPAAVSPAVRRSASSSRTSSPMRSQRSAARRSRSSIRRQTGGGGNDGGTSQVLPPPPQVDLLTASLIGSGSGGRPASGEVSQQPDPSVDIDSDFIDWQWNCVTVARATLGSATFYFKNNMSAQNAQNLMNNKCCPITVRDGSDHFQSPHHQSEEKKGKFPNFVLSCDLCAAMKSPIMYVLIASKISYTNHYYCPILNNVILIENNLKWSWFLRNWMTFQKAARLICVVPRKMWVRKLSVSENKLGISGGVARHTINLIPKSNNITLTLQSTVLRSGQK